MDMVGHADSRSIVGAKLTRQWGYDNKNRTIGLPNKASLPLLMGAK